MPESKLLFDILILLLSGAVAYGILKLREVRSRTTRELRPAVGRPPVKRWMTINSLTTPVLLLVFLAVLWAIPDLFVRLSSTLLNVEYREDLVNTYRAMAILIIAVFRLLYDFYLKFTE